MFKRRQRADSKGYYSCGVTITDLDADAIKRVDINGRGIIVTKVSEQIYAFDETCPHGAASLANGSLSGHKIGCVDHGYCFDVRSGFLIWPEDEPYRLRMYQAKVDNGYVKIKL